jgi:quercetin dioxygenase-like cupin family protein
VPVPEARLEETDAGAVVASEGWFVLNLADVVWKRNEKGGEYSDVEPRGGRFEQYGISVHVLRPGQPNGLYHCENVQEDFLVLSGECLLLVEEEERRLNTWDFVHCAPGTHHIFVGAGDRPGAILMVGARGGARRCTTP